MDESPSVALVTNTMVYEAASLVEDPLRHRGDGTWINIARFFDLSSLIESVVLYEQVLTLQGTVADHDVESLSLVQLLKSEEILREGSLTVQPANVRRALGVLLGSDRLFGRIIAPAGITLYVSDMLPELFPDDNQDTTYIVGEAYESSGSFIEALGHPYYEPVLTNPRDIFAFFQGDDFGTLLTATGEYNRGPYLLRTFVYQQAAVDAGVVFCPDYPRVHLLRSLSGSFRTSLISQAHALFAKKLQCEAEQFLQDIEPMSVPIPPFTAVLLDRCREKTDIGPELIRLRSEHKNLREQLSRLEKRRRQCTNISERNEVRKRTEEMFRAATAKLQDTDTINLEDAVSLAEDAVGVLLKPTDPGSYSASPLLKAMRHVKRWWYTRPLTQLFDAVDKYRKIDEYNLLVSRVLGVEFSDADRERFRDAQHVLNRLFSEGRTTPN